MLNDSVVARDLLRQAAAAQGAENGTFHARVDGLVTGWCAAQSQARLGKLTTQWKAFAKRGRFWHLHPAAALSPVLQRARPPVPALPAPQGQDGTIDGPAGQDDDKVIQLPAPGQGKDQVR